MNSNNTASAIDSWHKHSSSRIDFTFQNYKIEVKTASVSNRKHVIKQNQIKIVKDEKLYIASVLIEQSDSGKNIYDIVQEIQSKIRKESIQSKKLMSQVTDLVGNKLIECTNYRIDIRSALNSIQFYDANDIPIIEEIYISPLLSNLSYEIDFSKLDAIDTKEILFI